MREVHRLRYARASADAAIGSRADDGAANQRDRLGCSGRRAVKTLGHLVQRGQATGAGLVEEVVRGIAFTAGTPSARSSAVVT